jgi:hypothetical protein
MKKSKNKIGKVLKFGHKIPCPNFENGDKCLQKTTLLGDAVKTLKHRIPTHHKNRCMKFSLDAGWNIIGNFKRNLCNLCRNFGRLLE